MEPRSAAGRRNRRVARPGWGTPPAPRARRRPRRPRLRSSTAAGDREVGHDDTAGRTCRGTRTFIWRSIGCCRRRPGPGRRTWCRGRARRRSPPGRGSWSRWGGGCRSCSAGRPPLTPRPPGGPCALLPPVRLILGC